jgi:hypothetical protein
MMRRQSVRAAEFAEVYMGTTSIWCSVAGARVAQMTELEGHVTQIICVEYDASTGTCRLMKAAREGGPLTQLLEAVAEDSGILIRSPSPRGVAEEAPGAYKDVEAVVDAGSGGPVTKGRAPRAPGVRQGVIALSKSTHRLQNGGSAWRLHHDRGSSSGMTAWIAIASVLVVPSRY